MSEIFIAIDDPAFARIRVKSGYFVEYFDVEQVPPDVQYLAGRLMGKESSE